MTETLSNCEQFGAYCKLGPLHSHPKAVVPWVGKVVSCSHRPSSIV